MRDRVNRVIPQLPRTVLQPTVEKLDPTASPVITVAVTADKPLRDITEFADKRAAPPAGELRRRRPGRGHRRPQAPDQHLARTPNCCARRTLSVNDVARALQSQNADIPGGRMDQGAQSVTLRTRGRVDTVDGFGDVVLREVAGHPVRLRDVARVEDGMAEPRTQASVNGEATVLLQIRKQSGTNTVEVANNVKQRLAGRSKASLPARLLAAHRPRRGAVHRGLDRQRRRNTSSSARSWRRSWCCLFLGNFRSTMIAAIAIPTSIIATFALIWYMGFTLNMLTMLALTLSVGIVIDDAIVVLENIYRFIEEKGMPPMQAAVEATQEIGLAVMATTLLAGRDLRAGRLHERHGRPLHEELRPDDGVRGAGVAVCQLHADADDVGLLAEAAAEVTTNRTTRSTTVLFEPLDRGYTRLLEWAMAHRGIVAVAGGRWCCCRACRCSGSSNVNFTPEDDQSQFDVTVRAPEGTSLAATEVLANRVATAIRRIPEVDFTLVTVAGDAAGTLNTASDAGAPAAARGAQARSVRGHGRRSATTSCRRCPRRRAAPRCRHRRRPRRWRRRTSSS